MFLRARYVFRTSIGTALLGHGMNTTSKQVGTKNVPSRQARQSGWLVQKMYHALGDKCLRFCCFERYLSTWLHYFVRQLSLWLLLLYAYFLCDKCRSVCFSYYIYPLGDSCLSSGVWKTLVHAPKLKSLCSAMLHPARYTPYTSIESWWGTFSVPRLLPPK